MPRAPPPSSSTIQQVTIMELVDFLLPIRTPKSKNGSTPEPVSQSPIPASSAAALLQTIRTSPGCKSGLPRRHPKPHPDLTRGGPILLHLQSDRVPAAGAALRTDEHGPWRSATFDKS